MNRRDFLRTLGGTAVLSSLAGCASTRTKYLPSETNDTYFSPIIDCAWRCSYDVKLLRARGIQTIFRYLAEADQPNSGLTSKRLTKQEVEILMSAGFAIGSVYQFYSNESSFPNYMKYGRAMGGETRRFCFQSGQRDARAALLEAESVGQPLGSAIYFGVDGSMKPSEMQFVRDYFQAIKEVVNDRFTIGVYGSGLTASTLLNSNLVEYTWIAKSPRWWETRQFFNSGRWSIFQYAHMVPLSSATHIKGIDLNVVDPQEKAIGQWPTNRGYGLGENRQLQKSLRFVKTPTLKLMSMPDNRGTVVAEFKGMTARTVTVLGGTEVWPRVQVADEFSDLRPSGVSIHGYCQGDQLTRDYSIMPQA